VLSPPLPGIGERILSPAAQSEYWYEPRSSPPPATIDRLAEIGHFTPLEGRAGLRRSDQGEVPA
jgi:hypothetical protein